MKKPAKKVYLLMEYGMQDESDVVLGVFSSRKDATATLVAIDAIPWTIEPDETTAEGRYYKRDIAVEGHEWVRRQFCFDAFRSPTHKGPWPPKFPGGIVEVEVRNCPLAVAEKKETPR